MEVLLMSTLASLFLGSTASAYVKDFCYCNLDSYLLDVRSQLLDGKEPATYVPPEIGTTTSNGGAENTATTSTASGATDQVTDTTAAAPARKKREVDSGDIEPLFRSWDGGAVSPLGGVSFHDLRLAEDTGIIFDSNYRPEQCSCLPGSVVEVRMCLLNLPFEASLEDTTASAYRNHTTSILSKTHEMYFNKTWYNEEEDLFRRILLHYFERDAGKDNSTIAVLHVELTKRVEMAEYKVMSQVEPVIRASKGKIGTYVTNHEDDCLLAADITPPKPFMKGPFYDLRFLTIPVALAVFGLVIYCACCGKRDSFYVRFW